MPLRSFKSFGGGCEKSVSSGGAENQKALESFGRSCEKEYFVTQSRNAENFAELWCEL